VVRPNTSDGINCLSIYAQPPLGRCRRRADVSKFGGLRSGKEVAQLKVARLRFSVQTGEATTRRGKWTIDVRSTVQSAVACALVVALLALLHRSQGEAVKWPLVQGNIQDTRIVADHALETKWGGQVTWKAEYKVAYLVASREYAVWADSGIRGESEAGVRLALPQSLPSCRVQYNPKKPGESVADCR
jgi:hypothetical protein